MLDNAFCQCVVQRAGMLVLVAALGLERKVAVRAVGVIHLALACPGLPRDVVSSAEEALLQFQTVPRLSAILRPQLPALHGVDPDSKEGEHASLTGTCL